MPNRYRALRDARNQYWVEDMEAEIDNGMTSFAEFFEASGPWAVLDAISILNENDGRRWDYYWNEESETQPAPPFNYDLPAPPIPARTSQYPTPRFVAVESPTSPSYATRTQYRVYDQVGRRVDRYAMTFGRVLDRVDGLNDKRLWPHDYAWEPISRFPNMDLTPIVPSQDPALTGIIPGMIEVSSALDRELDHVMRDVYEPDEWSPVTMEVDPW